MDFLLFVFRRGYRYLSRRYVKFKRDYVISKHGFVVYKDPRGGIVSDIISIGLFESYISGLEYLQEFRYLPKTGAADAKLMYLLSQVCELYKPGTVLEFGSGQSTQLLSLYAKKFQWAKVISIENDHQWAGIMRQHLPANHSLKLLDCSIYNRNGKQYAWYTSDALAATLAGTRAELILIDGPHGSKEYSRFGIVQCAGKIVADDFIVIMDDMHRYGEVQTFAELKAELQKVADVDHIILASGTKHLGLIFTHKFSPVKNFY